MEIGIKNIKQDDFKKIERLIITALINNGFDIKDSVYVENEKNEHVGFDFEL